MKINAIVLKGNNNYNFELNRNVTIIYDESGAGKTLLFKLIEYALGSDGTKIDAKEAQKVYPGLYEINMKLSNEEKEYLFVRKIPKNTKNDVVYCDDKIIPGTYNDILNRIINYNPIKVVKNKEKMETSTFSLREYVKCLFFNESRMTSSDSLLTENYTEKSKIKNFYKYLVTGEILDEKELIKAKNDIQLLDSIKISLKTLAKGIEEPTKENEKLYKFLNNQVASLTKKIDKNQEIIKDLSLNKNEKMINKERLLSLKQLFESQIEDNDSALQFASFLKNLTIKCECGRDINIVDIEFNEDEYYDLRAKIKDIEKQLIITQKEIDALNASLDNAQKDLDDVVVKLNNATEELAVLTKKIEDYDVYKKMLSIFKVKREKKEKNTIIEAQQKNIDDNFDRNIKRICELAQFRLEKWGIDRYSKVEFDSEVFDFKFNGTLRYHLSKGYKNICTSAVIIEILLQALFLKINSLNSIVIDSFWSHLFITGIDTTNIINNIVKDLEKTDIQILIMENRIPTQYSSQTSIYKISDM